MRRYTRVLSVLLAVAVVNPSRAQAAPPPDEARLRAMSARFAPVEIGADLSRLPEGERRALAKMVEAARIMDALFLRQVWAGNEALLLELVSDRTPLGQARLQAFVLDKGPWSRLDHDAPFVPGVPQKPEGANFYPAGARREEVEAWMKDLPEAERAVGAGLLHDDPPRPRRAPGRRPVQRRVPGRAGARGGAAARGRRSDRAADAPALPRDAGESVPEQRLLRERRRLDGAGRVDRAHDRPLRDLRGRLVRLQGGLRGVHHAARRWRDAEARPAVLRAAVARGQAADRAGAAQPEARRSRPDPRGRRGVLGRRRQPRRADGGLQPAQRRARRLREGQQARDAEEHAARQVRRRAAADLEDRAGGARPAERRLRRLLHPHPDARADARPRPPARSASAAARRPCGWR